MLKAEAEAETDNPEMRQGLLKNHVTNTAFVTWRVQGAV
jgi:hypothetical protein